MKISPVLLYLMVGLFISLPLQAAEPISFELAGEKIEFKTDGRVWVEGSRSNAGNKGVVEYILSGENVKQWSELVTINYFTGLQGDDLLERFVNFTKSGLQKQCTDVRWEELAKKPDGVIYAWTAQRCANFWPDQGEVARVIKGKQGLYVLHYANKKVPIPQEQQAAWFSLLNKAEIKSPS